MNGTWPALRMRRRDNQIPCQAMQAPVNPSVRRGFRHVAAVQAQNKDEYIDRSGGTLQHWQLCLSAHIVNEKGYYRWSSVTPSKRNWFDDFEERSGSFMLSSPWLKPGTYQVDLFICTAAGITTDLMGHVSRCYSCVALRRARKCGRHGFGSGTGQFAWTNGDHAGSTAGETIHEFHAPLNRPCPRNTCRLRAYAMESGIAISVIVPALNEAQSIRGLR